MFQLSQGGRKEKGQIHPSSAALTQALRGLDDGTTLGGQTTVRSPSVQMPVSSGNTLTGLHRNNGQSGKAVAGQADLRN